MNLPMTVLTTACVVFFMPLKKVEGDWKRLVLLKLPPFVWDGLYGRDY